MYTYEDLEIDLKVKLHIEGDINPHENLLAFGLNSLQVMRQVNEFKKHGIKVDFVKLFETPTLSGWWKLIEGNLPKQEEKRFPLQSMLGVETEKPFPMTDVQYAYWVGRGNEQVLGGIGTHAYIEFEGRNIDLEKLNNAFCRLQEYHPMLRAKFRNDGMQEIKKVIFTKEIDIFDLREKGNDVIDNRLIEIRENRNHRKLEIEKGQVIALAVSLLPENRHRIHFELDLLVADVQSLKIILRDLLDLYECKELSGYASNWSFAKYIQSEMEKNSKEKMVSKAYWLDRLKSFPKGPLLPLAKQPEQIEKVVFKRRAESISKKSWQRMKELAKSNHTTSAMMLLGVYVKVLERFSASSHFLINIPLFNRDTSTEGIEEVVADFTTLLLLEIDVSKYHTFLDLVKGIDHQVHTDMSYSSYSGVELQREYSKLHKGQSCIAPVVYACNLGMPLFDKNLKEKFGGCNYMLSQTPQIWIDFQLFEEDDCLKINWDTVDELFHEGLIDAMFESLSDMILWLGSENCNLETDYDAFPKSQKKNRLAYLNTKEPEIKKCIHPQMLEYAAAFGGEIALIESGSGISVTYKELAKHSLSIANYLIKQGIRQEAIAITLERGSAQIKGAYGILTSGNHYVPISVSQPANRRNKIHERLKISYVITDRKHSAIIKWPEGTKILLVEEMTEETPLFVIPEVSPEETAYIILTSGSTGEPKGVEISHYSAWNTIEDINNKYLIHKKDTGFAVSEFDFDLSVYDIFGILSAGGKLILLPEEEKKNTQFWMKQIIKYQVTIWNSVPILFDMLLTQAEEDKAASLPLRVAMLSGDWIGLDLPKRFCSFSEAAHIAAMGGATEASIWSNYYDVGKTVPNHWVSIPYGRPLKNQCYRVVDERGRDCPDWVTGELYIGGAGVAKGYKNDETLTKSRFFTENGIRWYKTGDMGRYWQDGILEFLGRKDSQVKIRGHRIEMGEIEAALESYQGIKDSVVIVAGEDKKDRYLAAFFTLKQSEKEEGYSNAPAISIQSVQTHATKIQTEELKNYIASRNRIAHMMVQNLLQRKEDIDSSVKGSKYEALWNKWTAWEEEISLEEEDINPGDETPQEEKDTVLMKLQDNLQSLLLGEKDTVEFFYSQEEELSPIQLQKGIPGYGENEEALVNKVNQLVDRLKETKSHVRILDIGNRNPNLTRRILSMLDAAKISYTYADSSEYFLEEARSELVGEKISYQIFNIENDCYPYSNGKNEYDIIISYYSLHRAKNINTALQNLKNLLLPDGMLILAELSLNTRLMDIIIGLLEKDYGVYEDERKYAKQPLLCKEDWSKALIENGFASTQFIHAYGDKGCYTILSQNGSEKPVIKIEKLKEHLRHLLPEYMIPRIILPLNILPVTANGKVNRSKLSEFTKVYQNKKVLNMDMTDTQKRMEKLWKQIFTRDSISLDSNYFEIGGDSLIAVKLIAQIKKEFQIEITIGKIFEHPTFRQLCEMIEKNQSDSTEKENFQLPCIAGDPENQYKSFPLTDVQYAYWMGRNGLYELGEVSTHCYFEMDATEIDYERLCETFNKLIQAHPMMRAVIMPTGEQRILESVLYYKIEQFDLNHMKNEDRNTCLSSIREKMEGQVVDTSKWPLFDVKVSCFDLNKVRIHMSFDNIIFDGFSMFSILEEWGRLYRDSNYEIAELEITFRDYVLGILQLKNSKYYELDKKYWLDRLKDLERIPELPIYKTKTKEGQQKFSRRSYVFDKKQWEVLKQIGKGSNITPSVLLLTAFTEVLKLWSKTPDFTINVTRFNRLSLHPHIEQMIGDFTTLTLLEVNNELGDNFRERAGLLQKQLMEDLNHSLYSGVEVEREIRSKKAGQSEIVMPVVFTSGLGVKELNEDMWLGKINYNVSQTPQVWLDHQVSERNGNLILSWDALDGLFYEGVLDEMFHAYIELLNDLIGEVKWEAKVHKLIKIPNLETRILANKTDAPRCEDTLDGIFLKAAKKFPYHTAIVDGMIKMTYKELYDKAFAIKEELFDKGIEKGDIIGVFCKKGWQQIAAVYGILFAGAVYLPLDTNNPVLRIKSIIGTGDVKMLLTQDELVKNKRIEELSSYINIDKLKHRDLLNSFSSVNKPEDLAYIIYTSGSTGEPKGVMIEHAGAVNTIYDINQRLGVNEKDAVLALSNLHFDLSVYDIFGILAIGGKVVIPGEEQKMSPSDWYGLLLREQITIWNTVPAYMQILTDYLRGKALNRCNLREILLSGDWISHNLVEAVHEQLNGVHITALGGATEASIWSNFYSVPREIPENLKMMPYGKPLTNQRYYVLHENMSRCPNWVTGMLYIAGEGLARGYYQDSVRTNEKFVFDEALQEWLYCTGDFGRYWPDGTIEFLGREDNQVKINGYRVELGEIENALKTHENVSDSIAVVIEIEGSYQIVSFFVPVAETEGDFKCGLKSHIEQYVPAYMIPKNFIPVSAIPLSNNGKVDRKALEQMAREKWKEDLSQKQYIQPRTEVEEKLWKRWKEILGIQSLGVNEDFFELGGNSLQAIQIVNFIMETIWEDFEIEQLFENSTIEQLAAAISER